MSTTHCFLHIENRSICHGSELLISHIHFNAGVTFLLYVQCTGNFITYMYAIGPFSFQSQLLFMIFACLLTCSLRSSNAARSTLGVSLFCCCCLCFVFSNTYCKWSEIFTLRGSMRIHCYTMQWLTQCYQTVDLDKDKQYTLKT